MATDDETGIRKNPRQRGQPRPVTAQSLDNAALHYLERFASSAANLRRVLLRRVAVSVRLYDTDAAQAEAWVDALVARLVASGLVNDDSYAHLKAAGLSRRGASTRMIRAGLAAKGVASEVVDGALERVAEDTDGDPDTTAALALARRRRLGPYRPPDQRAAHRDKDLAALGRAGFDYHTARLVIDAADPDDIVPR
jgi:regulatory protein